MLGLSYLSCTKTHVRVALGQGLLLKRLISQDADSYVFLGGGLLLNLLSVDVRAFLFVIIRLWRLLACQRGEVGVEALNSLCIEEAVQQTVLSVDLLSAA